VYADDVYIVSYPKSGNTWLRFLLANLLYPDADVNLSNIDDRMPSIYEATKRQMELVSRPRYIKSHEPFHPRYPNIIYIVRDPRDVAVSYYYYALKKGKAPREFRIENFVDDFIGDKIENLYGSWADHVAGWLAMRQSRKNFLLLRYKDLLEDTHRQLSKIAVFLGIPLEEKKIDRAVQLSTADRMRRLEREGGKKWSETKGSRMDIPFVRAAKANQWSGALPPRSVMAIEAAWGPVMMVLGYKLVNDPARLAAISESWARWEAQSVSISATKSREHARLQYHVSS